MPSPKNSAKTFLVDGRVSIALDALDDAQKRTVGGVIVDRDHFVACAADPGRVRKISRSKPVYALSVPSGLDIIYRVSGEQIEVLDLMGRAALLRYGARRKHAGGRASKKPGRRKGAS